MDSTLDIKSLSKSLSPERRLISTKMVFDYHIRLATTPKPRELVLLLHGFSETGKSIFKKVAPIFPEDTIVIAPNGPFPMAFKKDGGYKVTFSWFFFDPVSHEYFIDMEVALSFLSQGIQSLGYEGLPKRIIGFSQGGYLAPFAAHELGGVSQVIGIGCEYLADELPKKITFRLDGIHGSLDNIIQVKEAETSHFSLREQNISGELHLLPETGHEIDSAVLLKLEEILKAGEK